MTKPKFRGRRDVMGALLVLLLCSMISRMVGAPSPQPSTLTSEDTNKPNPAIDLLVNDNWKQSQLYLEGTRHSAKMLRLFIDILPHDVKTKRYTLDDCTAAEAMKVAKLFLARWPLIFAQRPAYNRSAVEQVFDKLNLMVKDENAANRPMSALAYQVARGVRALAVDILSGLITDVEAMQKKLDAIHSNYGAGEFYTLNGTIKPEFSTVGSPGMKATLALLSPGKKDELMPIFDRVVYLRQEAYGYITSATASVLWADVKALKTIRDELVQEDSDSDVAWELARPLLERVRLSNDVVMDTLAPTLEFTKLFSKAAREADAQEGMFEVMVLRTAIIENVTPDPSLTDIIPNTRTPSSSSDQLPDPSLNDIDPNTPTPSSSSAQLPAGRQRRSVHYPESPVSMDYELPSASLRNSGNDGPFFCAVPSEKVAFD